MKLTVDNLSSDQRVMFDAMDSFVRSGNYVGSPILRAGGFAGSGKTTVLGVFAAHAQKLGKTIAYVAFTGRASSVLGRSLKAAGVQLTTKPRKDDEDHESRWWDSSIPTRTGGPAFCGTIHRLIYKPIINAREELCGWNHRELLDRDYDVIVADECFHYAQRVLTEDGWCDIGTLVNKRLQCRMWSLNRATGALELKPIVRWLRRVAPEKLLRINVGRTDSMRAARQIRCTPSHKILTPHGYVRAGALSVGDELVVRGRGLTPLQFSVLVGSMLGDASMNRQGCRNSPQPVFVQGDDQRSWLSFKKRVFGSDMTGPIQRGSSGYGDKPVWRFTLNVTDQTRRVAEQMPYKRRRRNGRRYWVPTAKFLSWVDAPALAVWFLDDGSVSWHGQTPYASIHTECFDRKTNCRLASFLARRFGVAPSVSPDTRGNFLLRFNKVDTARLLNIVRPFTPKCMAWKVRGGGFNPMFVPASETTVAPIRKIESVPGGRYNRSHVFDLEVADNHNYIAGNVVVSNCSMIGDEMLLDLQAFGAPILAVGDHGQLPPVRQAGSLMKDPDIKLETIHRQAEGNPIIALSRHVREGGYLAKFKTSDPRVSFRYKRDLDAVLKDAYGKSERAIDVGILCWTNRQRIALNMAARKTLGRRGAPQSGEVIIWLRNSPPIFNGMRGVLTRDSFPGYKPWHLDTMIEFAEEGLPPCAFILCAAQFNRERVFENVDELRERGIIVDEMSRAGKYADFGYALTTHKSQGSQFEHTIVFMDMPEKPHDENYRRWAYTSITRSADRLSILAR